MKHLQSSTGSNASSGCPFAQNRDNPPSEVEEGKSEGPRLKRNPDSFSSFGSCPFAQALHQKNDVDDCSSSSSIDNPSAVISSPPSIENSLSSLPWKECPVFANRSCPFKDVKSPDDVSQILMQLPASHTDQALPTHAVLIETLAYFHRDRAMEEYSFSAIMTKLVQEHYAQTGEHHSDEDAFSVENDSRKDSDEFQMQPTKEQTKAQEKRSDITPEALGEFSAPIPPQRQTRRLSEALKTGTEEAHHEAESVHFVKNFIRGKIDRNLYALFVAQMFHVYRRLEKELDEHAPQHFADCHFPEELNRSEALKEDIDFWQAGSEDPPISPATQDYLDRITKVAKERPLLLLAHSYTRYLGDLSGGKILARVAKRALHLDSGADGLTEGLAFYDFPLLRGSVKAFKDRYRQALNDLEFDDSDEAVQAIVKEANVAFMLNMRLFEELDVIGSVPGASVRPIDQVYTRCNKATENLDTSQSNEYHKQNPPAQCPFANVSGANLGGAPAVHKTSKARQQAVQQKGQAKTCPWPFIFCHDPKTGMRQWQTWVTIGLILMYTYQKYCSTSLSQ